jgi:putative hydrolase of the HAD superfamily
MLKAVIFDLDNTLTDFMKVKEAAIEAAVDGMIDAGLEMTPDIGKRRLYEIYDREGIEYQRVFDHFLKDELGWVDPKIWAAAIVAYRRAREGTLTLYPHVHMTLTELVKRGLRLAVLSDAPRQQAWLRLCYLKLHHMFDHVITFEDTGERKPSEKPFRRVLKLLGVRPDEALMVGDWPERDMVGATHVGIRTVFARYGDTFGIKDPGADFEIDDIKELLTIVDSINTAST